MAYPRFIVARRHKHVDSGAHADYTIGTSFADIDTTNLSITIEAQAGDVLVISAQGAITAGGNTANYLTATVNNVVLGGSNGLSMSYGASGYENYVAMVKHYTVLAGDIVSGQVTVRPQAKSAISTTLAGSNPPFQFAVENLGPQDST